MSFEQIVMSLLCHFLFENVGLHINHLLTTLYIIITSIAHRIKNPLRRTSEHIASYIFKTLHKSM